ncbi:MAG: DUF2087 domain-containing protein [Eubacteriales bacterium]|nr:DUF2087 domain-containing protein [Eubacteriales bacterium]MDD3881580.1 DUF2087 domain-containing protein [Eubacteriales bacterium]MDD4512361.1 DUF2087 domain-containing protein [Eubacteriales bacterium]
MSNINNSAALSDEEAFREKVLTTFIKDGRLTNIPVKSKKRAVVLDYIAEMFEPERRYTEKEVNEIILTLHEDYCSIRREMADTGRINRKDGIYWRDK